MYTGILTLAITLKNEGTTELQERFTMYTNERVRKKLNIPKSMSFQEIIPYADIEPLINEVKFI